MVDTVIFCGGGNRSFWQAGFWSAVSQRRALAPRRVLAVSAGAFVAAGLFSGTIDGLLDSASRRFRANPGNFHGRRLLRLQRPFPHPPIYRACLEDNLDQAALTRLQRAPAIHVLTASPPGWLPLAASLTLSSACYFAEKFLWRSVHARAGRRLGFRPHWHRLQDCAGSGAMVDLICASSCVPPFFPVRRFGGNTALDGGYVDSNPLPRADEFPQPLGTTLVLLTRRYRRLPQSPTVRYVQPSVPLPVANFDATAWQGVRAAFALGLRDGERYLDEHGMSGGAPSPDTDIRPQQPAAGARA